MICYSSLLTLEKWKFVCHWLLSWYTVIKTSWVSIEFGKRGENMGLQGGSFPAKDHPCTRLSPRASLSTRGKCSLVKPFRHLEASFLSSLHCCCCPKSLVSCKASTSSLRSRSCRKKPAQLTHKTGRSCQNVEDMTFLEFLESWLWLFFLHSLTWGGKKTRLKLQLS